MNSTKNLFLCVTAICGAVTLLVTGCQESKSSYPQRQMPAGLASDGKQVQKGQQLFHSKCAQCHGKPSEGRSDRADFFEPPAMDFSGHRYRKIDPAFLYWRIETGKTVEPYRSQGSVMPAWGVHFSEQQVWQIVAYLRHRAH